MHALVREPAARLDVEQTVCDLADPDDEALTGACEGAQTIVHLAGENELVAAHEPAAALASTVVATEKISEACAQAAVKRLVYMSTVHVYGERIAPGVTLTEDMRPEPRSAYAISRLASEHIAASLAQGAYELVILRLTNSVGAPDDPSVDRWSLVANDLCRQGSLTGRLELRSSGIQWRDFAALSAVCDAIGAASQVPDSDPSGGISPAPGKPAPRKAFLPPGTYNLGSGRPTTVRELAGMIQDAFELQTGERPPLHAPAPEAHVCEPYHVSIERAARHGIRLSAPLQDAVSETVRFCLEHREELR